MITDARKAELFDRFIIEVFDFVHLDDLVECMTGMKGRDELIPLGHDYDDALRPLLDLLTDEELDEAMQLALPKLIMDELGAKKVTIKWE